MYRVTIQRLAAVAVLLAATPVVAQTYRDEQGRPIDPRLVLPPTPMTVAPPTDGFAPPAQPAPTPLPQTSATLKGSGSGVVIGAHEVLTANHVVDGCTAIGVFRRDAYVAWSDKRNDLAVVHSTDQWASVASFSDEPIRAGDEVIAMGYPLSGVLADSANVSVGNVSNLAGVGNDLRYLQISAPIQKGNSGGPLFDTNGTLVGIVTSKLDALKMLKATGDIPENVNFAIKSDVVRTFLDSGSFKYQTAGKLQQKLVAREVGEKARPLTVKIECYGPQNEAKAAPPQQQPPLPAQQLACESPQVTNTLMRIGLNIGVAVFSINGQHMLSGTDNMIFCRALVWSSAGKRIVNYTVTLANRETGQIWVQVTGYSGSLR